MEISIINFLINELLNDLNYNVIICIVFLFFIEFRGKRANVSPDGK